MAKYLKKFENHSAYEAAQSGLILPNVSICTTEGDVHYNPYVEPVETRVVAKFNVTDTSNPTPIGYNQYTSGFSSIEIDGVETAVTSAYTFSTTGEHTVKYTLTDPTSIGNYAFYQCSGLTSIDIPNSVTTIGGGAFLNCSSLTGIDIPSGVTSIGNDAFGNCSSLTSINIPNSVTIIGNQSFQNCSGLTSCTIGNGVTSIGDNAFRDCRSLTSCTIGSSVTSIGSYAFSNCTSLTSIEIPSGVTSINYSAFWYCSSLTSIVCNATTAPTIQSNTFQGDNTAGTLTVPIGSSGYDVWMQNDNYYLGKYGWTKVEQ